MKTIATLYKRELAAAFHNPGVYVVAGLFFFLVSVLVIHGVLDYAERSTSRDATAEEMAMDYTQTLAGSSFGAVSILFVFVVPIITMRAFAEERRSGMFELLATWPIRDWELILGKFLSLATVLVIMDAFMGFYVAVFYWLGEPDTGVILSAGLGLVLASLAYVSFGLFASALTENQIIAAIITFVGLFFFWVIQNVGGDGTTAFSRLCDAASMSLRFADFVKGLVTPGNVVYFLGFSFFWLFMTARVLETRHWRA